MSTFALPRRRPRELRAASMIGFMMALFLVVGAPGAAQRAVLDKVIQRRVLA
jgi:hypothetical protein